MAALIEENIETDPTELLGTVVSGVQEFCGRKEFDDDVCLVAVSLRKLLTG